MQHSGVMRRGNADLCFIRDVIASEAKQSRMILPLRQTWIASSLRSLAQTLRVCRRQ
jgi:hypothetical protein